MAYCRMCVRFILKIFERMSPDASMQQSRPLYSPPLVSIVRACNCGDRRRPIGVLNEQSDGPVVPRPSSRLVGMLIVSRADRDAIRRRAVGRNWARECTRKGKGHRCKIARFFDARFPRTAPWQR